MSKEIGKKNPESLVKTSAEGSVELSEKELQQVAGGQKVKTDTQQKYMEIKLEDALISSYSTSG
jgi:bacteriocin-like protein